MNLQALSDLTFDLADEYSPTINITLLYDEFRSAVHAKVLCESVSQRTQPPLDVHLELWRFDLFRNPALRAEAVSQSHDASVVICAACASRRLPRELKLWTSEWLRGRSRQSLPCAFLVLLEDSRTGVDPSTLLFLDRLRAAEVERRFELLCETNPHTRAMAMTQPETDPERQDTAHPSRQTWLWEGPPDMHWGING